MSDSISFLTKKRKRVIVSKDFRETLITQETSIIEQRIIFMILSAIKDEQSLFINVKNPLGNHINAQMSFDDYFQGLSDQGSVEFTIPLRILNSEKKMKNQVIHESLISMTNINWLRLKDENLGRFMVVPFILEPSWDRNNIYFLMDLAVLKNLFNMTQFYQLNTDLPYSASTPNTVRFLLWLLKYQKPKFVKIAYSELLKVFNIPKNKYDCRRRFERDYLEVVKADLDALSDLSFRYSHIQDEYAITLYCNNKSIGVNDNSKLLNELKVQRSLKYLEKKRGLSKENLVIIKKYYAVKGYKEFSEKIKHKIDAKFKGDDFIKEIFLLHER